MRDVQFTTARLESELEATTCALEEERMHRSQEVQRLQEQIQTTITDKVMSEINLQDARHAQADDADALVRIKNVDTFPSTSFRAPCPR